jgi:hypothetical protein
MQPTRNWRCAPLLAGLVLVACEARDTTGPGFYTLRGHVKLTGYLVTPDGDFAGTKVVGDADGVVVELVFGDQIVGRTKTVHGVYTFHGLAPGGYVARTAGAEPLHDETNVLTIARSDLDAADTLRLRAMGDLFPVPNPVVHRTTIYFYVSDTMRVDMNVDDLAGSRVAGVVDHFRFPPGFWAGGWDGTDDTGRRATAPMYWLKFFAVPAHDSLGLRDERIHILFR